MIARVFVTLKPGVLDPASECSPSWTALPAGSRTPGLRVTNTRAIISLTYHICTLALGRSPARLNVLSETAPAANSDWRTSDVIQDHPMPIWAIWLAVFGCLLGRSLLAAVESALHSISPLRAAELAELYPGAGRRVLQLKTEREPTAAAFRVGLVILGFAAAALGVIAPQRMFDFSIVEGASWPLIVTALLSALLVGLLAIGLDVTMRAVARANPEGWALRLSWPVSLLVRAVFPRTRAMSAWMD